MSKVRISIEVENIKKQQTEIKELKILKWTEKFNWGVQQQTIKWKKDSRITQIEKKRKKRMKNNEDSIQDYGVPSNRLIYTLQSSQNKRKRRRKLIQNTMAVKLPNLRKEQTSRSRKPRDYQTRRIQRDHMKTHDNWMSKVEYMEKILKAARERQIVMYREHS